MMFITHFNKLIRNKILWTIISTIVCVSFVAMFTQTNESQDANKVNRTGKLDGKAVPDQEFQSAYFNSLLSMSLMFGKPIKVNAKVDEALRGMAWRRLAALRAAKAMDIAVSGDEVVGAIRQQPYFQEQGQFNHDRYRVFVMRFLASLQTTEAQFEEHIRQELLLNKIKYLLAQAAWVAPQEVENVFHQLYDTFVVSYVYLSQDDIASSVKVGEDQAKSFFEGHRDSFTIPEKMRVKWVAFPIEPFVDEGSLDEATLRSYYDDHIEEFTTRGSNDHLIAIPFESVEDDLRRSLAWDAALIMAGDRASDFEVALAPDKRGKAPDFDVASRAAGLIVTTSAYFSVDQAIRGLEGGLDFGKAAFELRRTPDDYFSNALKGSNAYYILAIDDRVDARVPEYAEVRKDVIAAAKEKALVEKLDQTARSIYAAASAAVEKGAPFVKAMKGSGLEVVTTDPFSVKEGIEDNEFEHFVTLVREMLKHNSGELIGLIPVKQGYIFGYVNSRKPASRALLESVRSDLSRYVRNRREGMVFTDWEEYLLASAKFEDLSPRKRAAAAAVVPEDDNYSDEDVE
jgi:hypothetical protein